MKKYQIWGFNYINKNGINVITGNENESEHEVYVLCFDGISFFVVNGKFYVAKYPKMRKLNSYYKEKIKEYCGYEPKAGEYGVIMGALGIVIECDYPSFMSQINGFLSSVKHKHQILLGIHWK